MSPDGSAEAAARWAKVEEIFAGALERSGETRSEWLAAACGGDGSLRAEVESLLAAHESGTAIPALPESDASQVDRRIGPFRLIEQIGSGGMGTVYLAERAGADYVQRVALKLIRGGWQDPELTARLTSERRILARLEHPNIARFIDGGLTPEGQPYFAMEYVQGVPLARYCDERRLTVRERLRLFLRVCDAVQHAHSQLIVHRDLKPTNILVTADGHPKLLDFGIAKLVDPSDEGASTRTGMWATPAYASPEQVRGEPAGTASDVYSLGVLLYELLAGRRPYHLDGVPPAEAQRIICEEPATRPSERLQGGGDDRARIAAARSLTAERLRRDLEGDLDTIVLKALAKEPSRRYGSAAALGEDIRRHLDGRPVVARPDSARYRASRFVRRHRTAVAAATLAVGALLAGAAAAVWQAGRATAEARAAQVARERAQDEARKAQLVTGLMTGLFRLSDPSRTLGDTVTARQLLDEGAARIDHELDGQPDVQAALFAEVSRVYAHLGLLGRADSLARRALELRTAVYGPGSMEVAETLGLLGDVLSERGERAEAIDAYRRAIEVRDRAPAAPDSVSVRLRTSLAWELRNDGAYDEARRLFSEALDAAQSLRGAPSNYAGTAMLGLATTLHDGGRFDEAEKLFRTVLSGAQTRDGPAPSPVVASALYQIGRLRRLREHPLEAEPLLRAAYEMRASFYDPSHPDVLDAAKEWGRALVDAGRFRDAREVLEPALVRSAADLGATHFTTTGFRTTLGWLALAEGRYADAAARFDTVLAEQRAAQPEHPETVFALVRSGQALLLAGRIAAAEARFREAMELGETVSGIESVYRMLAIQGMASVARERARFGEAAELFAEAESLGARLLRPDHRYMRRLRRERALLQVRTGDVAGAIAALDTVIAQERRILPESHPEPGWTQLLIAEIRLSMGDAPGARAALEDALARFAELPREHPHARGAHALQRDPRLLKVASAS